MKFVDDTGQEKALIRYQIISAYIALEPGRGRRGALLEQLAARVWTDTDGEKFQVAAETIRVWVRRYRKRGLLGLADKARPRHGVRVLSPEVIELACQLKRDVPARSLDRLLQILEGPGKVEAGLVFCAEKRTSTAGSLTIFFTCSRNFAGSSSGSIRTSRVALASDGITLER